MTMTDDNLNNEIITDNEKILGTNTKQIINSYLLKVSITVLTIFSLIGALGIYSFLSNMKQKIYNEVKSSIEIKTDKVRQETYINAAEAKLKVKEAERLVNAIVERANKADDGLNKAEEFAKSATKSANEISSFLLRNEDFKKEVAASAGNAMNNLRFEFKSINGLECDEKILKLGNKSDYLIWALSSQEIYRHGCNKGQTFCKVELNGNEWLLKAKNSSHHCNSKCGASIVNCTAIGIIKRIQ